MVDDFRWNGGKCPQCGWMEKYGHFCSMCNCYLGAKGTLRRHVEKWSSGYSCGPNGHIYPKNGTKCETCGYRIPKEYLNRMG